MNNVINFITTNSFIIILAIIIIAVAVYVIKKGKSGLYDAALYLVTVAEEEWGSKTGQIKFAEVITAIKQSYPIISLFVKEETLKRIIEDALVEMKAILAQKQAEESKDEEIPTEE